MTSEPSQSQEPSENPYQTTEGTVEHVSVAYGTLTIEGSGTDLRVFQIDGVERMNLTKFTLTWSVDDCCRLEMTEALI